MSYSMVTSSILRNRDDVYATQEQISSGKALNRPSDDPTAYERIARFRETLSGVERRLDHVSQAQSELNIVDSVLQDVTDLLQRVSEIAIQSSSGTMSPTDLQILGEEVNACLNGLISAANTTTFNGQALFDGLRGGKTAYEALDENGDGLTDAVAYQGNGGTRQVEAGDSTLVSVSIPGSNTGGAQAVFATGTVNLFTTLMQFRDRLLAGNSIADTDTLKQLDACQEHILGVQGFVGGQVESLRLYRTSLSQQEKILQNDVDQNESVDIAKAVMDLSRKQQAYEVALKAASTLSQNSLLDYVS